jgi:hypothetical protein
MCTSVFSVTSVYSTETRDCLIKIQIYIALDIAVGYNEMKS